MFRYLFIIPLLITQVAQAQQTPTSTNQASGTVVYHQEVNMQYLSVQSDTLHFDRTKSIFHWNLNGIAPTPLPQELENIPVGGTIKMQAAIYHGSRVNLHDTDKDSLFSLMGLPNINKLLYLKEKAPKINWSIEDSTKSIGNYTVQKATARFRGRDYTAWFSPEIPVPFGPWKLHGLLIANRLSRLVYRRLALGNCMACPD